MIEIQDRLFTIGSQLACEENKGNIKIPGLDENDIKEVLEIIEECNLDNDKIILMPEGKTVDEISKKMPYLAEVCKEKGWRLTPRLQVYIWGNQRKT